jgi:hypothetical protein
MTEEYKRWAKKCLDLYERRRLLTKELKRLNEQYERLLKEKPKFKEKSRGK